MSEAVLYLNPKWHTRQAKQAYQDLAGASLEVVEHSLYRMEGSPPALPADLVADHLAFALCPEFIPIQKKQVWNHAEDWVFGLLSDVQRIKPPRIIDQRLRQSMHPITMFNSVADAFKFLNYTQDRLGAILSDKDIGTHDTLRITTRAYCESRVLRMAMFQQEFLIKNDMYQAG
jgi:hypothetical protein